MPSDGLDRSLQLEIMGDSKGQAVVVVGALKDSPADRVREA